MKNYYAKVPPGLVKQFLQFRAEHPLKDYEVNGIKWEVLLSGDPSWQPLLLLPGGLSTAESSWRTISRLEQLKYYLLCPGYPPELDSMTSMADGIAEILTREQIQP